MTLISFTKQFAPAVENRTKLQTIRNIGGRKYKAGDALQLYKGRYAPGERIKMHDAICLSVQPIDIEPEFNDNILIFCSIILEGKTLQKADKEKFAKDDGFENLEYFARYFETEPTKSRQLIKWGLPFESLEVGKTYQNDNGDKVLINHYNTVEDCFEGKITKTNEPEFEQCGGWFLFTGEIYTKGFMPMGQPKFDDLKLEVAP